MSDCRTKRTCDTDDWVNFCNLVHICLVHGRLGDCEVVTLAYWVGGYLGALICRADTACFRFSAQIFSGVAILDESVLVICFLLPQIDPTCPFSHNSCLLIIDRRGYRRTIFNHILNTRPISILGKDQLRWHSHFLRQVLGQHVFLVFKHSVCQSLRLTLQVVFSCATLNRARNYSIVTSHLVRPAKIFIIDQRLWYFSP